MPTSKTNNPSRPSRTSMGATQALAQFGHDLHWAQVPNHVREILHVLMIDIFRASVGGIDRAWTQNILSLYQHHRSDRNAQVLLHDLEVDVAKAAFINATACGSLDWDDSHVAAIIHPGVCVWPAAIAMAQVTHASGQELLEACLVGYETAIRIGMSIQPEHSLRGFQGTPTCGAFGAAAACAKLLKLSTEQHRNALGIAATFACGISQFFVSGSDIKRFHAGKAAMNGVEAALLAHQGLSGPPDAIEGVQGFCRAFSDRFNESTILERLGEAFEIEKISLKPHAGSVRMQSAIECALYIAKKHSIPIEDIKHVAIGVHPAMVGKLTANQPVDHQQAQLSTPFAVAMAFYFSQLKGSEICLSIDDFASAFSNSDIMNLSAKITCHEDKEVKEKTTLEAVAARVLCKMKNGSEFEHFIEHPLGCPANPMRLDHISKRFIQLSEHKVGRQECLDWLASTLDIASFKSIGPLMNLRLKS
jgi:2-methylcitrate dehydratase PrpD